MFRTARRIAALAIVAAAFPVASAGATTYSGSTTVNASTLSAAPAPQEPETGYMEIKLEQVLISSATAGGSSGSTEREPALGLAAEVEPDSILIGLLLPAVQKIREAAAR